MKLSRKTLAGSYLFFRARKRAKVAGGQASSSLCGRWSVSNERYKPRKCRASSAHAASNLDGDAPNATTEKFADRCEYAVVSSATSATAPPTERTWKKYTVPEAISSAADGLGRGAPREAHRDHRVPEGAELKRVAVIHGSSLGR